MFDIEKCSVQDLETAVVAGATRLAASTAQWLLLVGEFDCRGGWSGYGIRSCAHWLSWKVGLGLRAAHEHLRVARALDTLPSTREAFLAGRLSYAKVRALVRAATPANEAELVALACSMPAAHLERLIRAYRTVTRDETLARHHRRRVEWRYDEDGSLLIRARLSPEDGAVVITAITAAAAALTPPAPPTQTGPGAGKDPARDPDATTAERTPASRADGLVALAETFLVTRKPRADPDRNTVIIHADAEPEPEPEPGCADSHPNPSGSTGTAPRANAHLGTPVSHHHHLDDGPGLHRSTISRLRCGAATRTLIRHRPRHHSGDTRRPPPGAPIGPGETLIDLGRRTHDPNSALRRAVAYRDHHTCQYPGCTNSIYTDIHHITPWHPDGRTDLGNLITLCRWHHRDHHEGGYTIATRPDGSHTFHQPDGSLIPHTPTPPPLTPDPDAPDVNPTAVTPSWRGEPLHINDTLTVLLTGAAACREEGQR